MTERLLKFFIVLFHVPYLLTVVLGLPILALILPNRVKLGRNNELMEIQWRNDDD